MAIKLYHDVPSSNCDRVKIVLTEKGLAWEGIWVRLSKQEQKSPEHLRRNPYGKIPVLEDDGKILFESCIINEYLEEQYPNPPLMPQDPYLRARGRILVDYVLNHLDQPYRTLRAELLNKGEAERNQQIVSEARGELTTRLMYLEQALGDQPYFLGEFSLADINMVPRFPRMEQYGVLPSPQLPNLSAWLSRMKQRPSIKTIL